MARTLNGTTDQLSLAGSYALLNPRTVKYWGFGVRVKFASASAPAGNQAIASMGQQAVTAAGWTRPRRPGRGE